MKRRWSKARLVLLAVAAVVGAVGAATASSKPSTTKEAIAQDGASARNGLIAFMRPGRVGEFDIWAVRPDGRGLRRVTTSPKDRSDYNPAWSPDGSTVLFERRVLTSQGDDLFTVSANGTGLRQLTGCDRDPDCWSDNEASWSRDGSRIAFGRATGPRDQEGPSKVAIYVASADGTGIRQLSTPPPGSEDHYPTWSADGGTVVFQRDPQTKLIAVDVATQAERVVYELPAWAHGAGVPKFAPDGKRILFSFWCIYGDSCPPSTRSARNARLATIRPDGTGLRRLPLKALGDSGAWSPDGTRIAFRCWPKTGLHVGNFRLCTSKLDGTRLKRFPWRLDSAHPDWGTHL
jgi:Tol biopolymer transport system component